MRRPRSVGGGRPIPRTIWALWLQGWDEAPEIVQACRSTWESLNPSWSFQPLTLSSLPALLGADALRFVDSAHELPPEALSDVVRIALLERYGGVWADSTTYCLQPLDDWLSAAMPSGFFAFAKPGPDRMISSWFLAAAPGNALVERWAARTRAYWTERAERDHYFWFHHIFAACYANDAAFRAVWDATPEILAGGACVYEPYLENLWGPASERDRRLVERPFTPLVKLTRRLPPGEYPPQSALRYLCERALAPAAQLFLPRALLESGSG
ncbi:MAG: hypothetical protein QOI11_195 [Candidatus Eremiobacteraeota bacterium]|jgi:hypothetical protein|nr:hypothetical protein [Candidatus Eremiobacteraeota bacterium]